MNTFLPERSFAACAEVLDDKRLNKQLVECQQILTINLTGAKAWSNHPAVRMWRNYPDYLVRYSLSIAEEIICRNPVYGRNHRSYRKIVFLINEYENLINEKAERPWWLFASEMVEDHRRNLIRKNNERYGKIWPEHKPLEGYRWPEEEKDVWRDLRK